MLRQVASCGSLLGNKVSKIMASGALVSDDLINEVVERRLQQSDCARGCILDGYPRTASQARFLEALLRRLEIPEPAIIDFQLTAGHVIERLSHRRQCPQCSRIFSVRFDAADAHCDHDGSLLIQRADDNPGAIRQRLETYRATFADLVGHYRSRNYHEIDASAPPEAIAGDVVACLNREIPVIAAPLATTAVQHSLGL